MDFVGYTISALKFLADICGNWGIAIIVLTIFIRVMLWHSSKVQQRSMRDMQKLQPKMKAIQDRYKSDPQKMQQKMAEFYKEHKFNPFGGCLPMLLQLPVFILLYSALISPQFISAAGDASFLFIKRLDATIKSNAGISFDGTFGVTKNTTFSAGKSATVFVGDEEIKDVKIEKPAKALSIQGEVIPAQPVDLKISLDSLDLKFSQLEKVTKADVNVINPLAKETENITFKRQGNLLIASVPTTEVKEKMHFDVIALVLLFIATMWFSQKVMTASNKNFPQDPQQAAMQKSMTTMMPVMIGVTFFFIPIPAGVLLYLVTSNIFQIIQTIIINKELDLEDAKKLATGEAVIEADVTK